MNWIEWLISGLIGGIIGLFISLLWQDVHNWYFGRKYLKPLIGKYKCYYKDGNVAEKYKEVEVRNVRSRTIELITVNNKDIKWESEIYFETSKYGKGWYKEVEGYISPEEKQNKHTFGISELMIVSNDQINVWNKYSKDESYGTGANFETINSSFYCIKI